MAQQSVNIGTVANDGTGDPLRNAFIKLNANEAELYSFLDREIKTISKTAHGFVTGNVLYLDSSGILQKITSSQIPIGIVQSVIDADTFLLVENGYVSGLSGLVAGSTYYVQSTGLLSTTVSPLKYLLADTTSSGYIIINSVSVFTQGSVIFAGATGLTEDNFNFSYDPTTHLMILKGFSNKVQFTQTISTSPIQIVGFTSDPSAPNEGEFSYNTTSHLAKFYNGTSWVSMSGWSVSGATTITGNTTQTGAFTNTFNLNSVVVTQNAITTGSPTAFVINGGAHTTLTAGTEAVDINYALNRTVQFATGALTTQRAFLIRSPTYGFVGASTITDAATLAITGAPVAGTNTTITSTHGLLIQGGNVGLNSSITSAYGLTVIAPVTSGGSLVCYSAQFLSGTGVKFRQSGQTGAHIFIDIVQSASQNGGGVLTGISFTGGAHVNVTGTSETSDIIFNLARSVSWSGAGTMALQRAFLIQAPTYVFQSAGTITDATTLAITGAPVKGSGVAITNTHALLIQAGAVSTATNSYGLTVNAQTGATNNYAAQFLGGKVLFSSSTTTAGFNVPGFTSDPSVPVEGDQGYNTTSHLMKFYNGTSWVSMSGGGGSGWAVTGSTTITGNTTQTGAFTNTFALNGLIVTQNALSSSWVSTLTVTPGAHTAYTAATPFIDYNFVARTVTWIDGTVASQKFAYFGGNTVNKTTTSATFTDIYTAYIDPSTAGAGVTFTRNWALGLGGGLQINSASQQDIAMNGSTLRVGTFSNNTLLLITNNTTRYSISGGGAFVSTGGPNVVFQTFTQAVNTTGASVGFLWTAGAHTSQTTATEVTDINWDLSPVMKMVDGTVATQRAFRIQGRTYTPQTTALTLTEASTLFVSPSVAGAGTTITNNYAIKSTGKLGFTFTYTAGGTNGNQTINFPTGSLNIAAAGTTVTLTNNLITTNSVVYPVLMTNDTTATSVKSAVVTAGQVVFTLNAACTAAVQIGFIVFN